MKDIACQEFRKRLDGLSPLMGAKEYSKFKLDFEIRIELSRLGAATVPTNTLAMGSAAGEREIPGEVAQDVAAIFGDIFETKDPNDERLERNMPLTIETVSSKGVAARRKAHHKGVRTLRAWNGELELFQRLVNAVNRLADPDSAPQGELHKPRPAELRTTTYTREGRELKEWKERAKEQEKRAPEPARR